MSEADESKENDCVYCEGKGVVDCTRCSGRGGRNVNRSRPASFDYNTGRESIEWETCQECDGTGRVKCTECWNGED